MCKMTDTGARWKRTVDLPAFGQSATYWAVLYCGETRYVGAVSRWHPAYDEMMRWLKPLYAVRVTARSI